MMRKLIYGLAVNETDVGTLQPFQRIAAEQICLYFVFCSLCAKMEWKEGILGRYAKCKLAYCCNKECQATHWEAGHKKACLGRKANQI